MKKMSDAIITMIIFSVKRVASIFISERYAYVYVYFFRHKSLKSIV